MRCAIVLAEGKYADELSGYAAEDGPRLEFVEIARSLDADVISYTSALAARGRLFGSLFGRFKKVGSAVNAALLARRYDRLYVTTEGVGLPLAILLKAMGWKGKIACVCHNLSFPLKKRVLSLLGPDIFSALITVNRLQAEMLVAECGMPPDKVMSVFNWVDDRFFHPDAPIAAPAAPFFMACGAENRDYDTLAKAAAHVHGRFAVYGHGYRASNLQAQAAPPNFEYMPRVSYSDLRDAYAACSIVVVPLNDVDYAAGVTGLVEALAAGRATVVTASRGIAEYIADFDPETVVPAGDDAAMAKAITRLNQDPALRDKLARANRQLAEDKCSVDKYVALVKARMLAA